MPHNAFIQGFFFPTLSDINVGNGCLLKCVSMSVCVCVSVCVLGSQTWSAEICEFCVSGDGMHYE